jgi:membrane-associated phospholipid phosphatase
MRGALAALAPCRRSADRWAVVYLLATGCYPLLNRGIFDQIADAGPLQAPLPHLVLHLVIAGAVWVGLPWLRGRSWPPARLGAEIAIPLLFPFFYGELRFLQLVYFGIDASFDPWLIGLERTFFGGQPSITWSQRAPWPWLRELMEFAYFSYYFFAVAALFLIWRAGRADTAARWRRTAGLVRDLTAVMLTCYTWYVFLPVWGPKYFAKINVIGPVTVDGWVFTDIMHYIHGHGALHGAAFPSSHVAGSMVSWWWIWKLFPRHRWWVTTLWLLLCASIVYCRYHYVVDLIGGVLWGGFVIWLCSRRGEENDLPSRRPG